MVVDKELGLIVVVVVVLLQNLKEGEGIADDSFSFYSLMRDKMKYFIKFKRKEGNKNIGSTEFELSKEQYQELKDVVKNEI